MKPETLNAALSANRTRLSVQILRRKAQEAADLAASLARIADNIEAELPPEV